VALLICNYQGMSAWIESGRSPMSASGQKRTLATAGERYG